ncbi:hypothetical protein K432DRAFT_468259 [Lepidopterella palustris CBS 459.81]|uniref:BTB domain-containing protein n=1 Tax=Lepidopterella palustris CBS 459.81 TaxID=1314670 RepID=A0A8E2E043_9PEZI|nr:hypothetical protein K432DRAFT_468259 [Lepidopterella palustris CBS 459.81]
MVMFMIGPKEKVFHIGSAALHNQSEYYAIALTDPPEAAIRLPEISEQTFEIVHAWIKYRDLTTTEEANAAGLGAAAEATPLVEAEAEEEKEGEQEEDEEEDDEKEEEEGDDDGGDDDDDDEDSEYGSDGDDDNDGNYGIHSTYRSSSNKKPRFNEVFVELLEVYIFAYEKGIKGLRKSIITKLEAVYDVATEIPCIDILQRAAEKLPAKSPMITFILYCYARHTDLENIDDETRMLIASLPRAVLLAWLVIVHHVARQRSGNLGGERPDPFLEDFNPCMYHEHEDGTPEGLMEAAECRKQYEDELEETYGGQLNL